MEVPHRRQARRLRRQAWTVPRRPAAAAPVEAVQAEAAQAEAASTASYERAPTLAPIAGRCPTDAAARSSADDARSPRLAAGAAGPQNLAARRRPSRRRARP